MLGSGKLLDGMVSVERLIKEIQLAKLRGVDVDQVFVDSESKLETTRTTLFGVKCGILFTFISPILLYGLKVVCAFCKVECPLPETVFQWIFAINCLSIIGSAYKLVKLPKWLGGGCETNTDTVVGVITGGATSASRNDKAELLKGRDGPGLPGENLGGNSGSSGWDGSIALPGSDNQGPT